MGVRTVRALGSSRLGLALHGPVPEVALSTDSTPDTDEYDDKLKAGGDELQEKEKDKLRDMSDRMDAHPEKNTDGDPETDPS